MLKAVLFDLDGTLLDTLGDLMDAVNHALLLHGFAPRSETEIRAFVGNGVQKLVERAVPEHTPAETTEKVFQAFKAYYEVHMADRTAPYAGIEALLRTLSREEIAVGVVSNKFDSAVKALCAHYFGECVRVAVGESALVRRKPSPDAPLSALAALNIAPQDAVYVGDSEVDLKTARAASLRCISVSWGFRDREFLKAQGAERIVDTPEELYKLLHTL